MTQGKMRGIRMADSQNAEEHQRGLMLIIGALMLAMLLAALDQTIVSTALPTIVSDLGGLNHLSWVVTAYMLSSTVSTPLWGKLGDQYGRKGLFQAAIVIFLLGSALCGLSENMTQLIGFRALQGLGGGGLMVLAQAIVGDVVSARDRGRYQGFFGAVFGVASVAGPLLGGLFVDHLSWHWVFYINLPIGILALIVIASALPKSTKKTRHSIDYIGTVLLGGSAACLVLLTSWGGTTYPWGDPVIIGLGIAAVVLLGAWIVTERRAKEPVLPLRLFALPVFSVASAIGFVVGFAMFGALTFLPLFLQVVHGVTPTMSGVHMLPMVFGMFLTSVLSGQLISKTGRYKVFPILGTGVTALGLFLMSTMDETSSTFTMSLYFFVLGFGLGLVMQVLVIVVQNAVDYTDLGVATSGATFFRSIGGSFGVAVFGAIFAGQLNDDLAALTAKVPLPPGFDPAKAQGDPTAVAKLPPEIARQIEHVYADAIQTVFVYAVPVALAAFVLSWFLKEVPLKETLKATDLGEGFGGAPSERTSLAELERAVLRLVDGDMRADYYRRLSKATKLDLPAGSLWVLCRLTADGPTAGTVLAKRAHTTVEKGMRYVEPLVRGGLVSSGNGTLAVTPYGAKEVDALVDARRRGLRRLLKDWSPDDNPELTEMIERLSRELLNADADREKAVL